MRNNLLIFSLAQLFLILIYAVVLIYLHLSPTLESAVYSHYFLRLIPAVLTALVYLIVGRFMNVKGLTDGILILVLPAVIWGICLAMAYFGGGAEGFVRGAFRSLWRFPADITMLPQMAVVSLLRLKQTTVVYAASAVIPQCLALLVAARGPVTYRRRRDFRRREK